MCETHTRGFTSFACEDILGKSCRLCPEGRGADNPRYASASCCPYSRMLGAPMLLLLLLSLVSANGNWEIGLPSTKRRLLATMCVTKNNKQR